MRKLISILGLVAVVGAGYFALYQYISTAYGQSSSSLLTADTVPGATTANGAQVLTLLNRLNGIKLDGKIFSSPAFQSLEYWSIVIPPQAVGRPNPYLPTGALPAATPARSSARTSGPQFLVR